MSKKTGIPSIDADQKKLDALQKRSDKAKGLVGKFFQIQKADGYAYYTVEDENLCEAKVVHHALMDGWQDEILGAGGWFPKNKIAPLIRKQEQARDFWDRAIKAQNKELNSYADVVGSAALKDLGDKVDVYELASWAWKRGQRQGIDDKRVFKDGRKPWASDIARGLADSKLFPAIKALKDDVVFIMLADKFEDPIVYRNTPPPKIAVLAAVGLAFEKALGVDPKGLSILREESKYMDNTFLEILGVGGKKIGSACYDAATGKILRVNIGFQVDEKGEVRSE